MALTVADFLQTKSYSAAAMRRVFLDSDLQPGVVGSTDLKVSQRAAGGANLSVDVAIGSGWVKGGFTTRQGLYHAYNDAIVNLAIGANTLANPRVDTVVLRVYDTTDGGSGQDIAAVEVWQGTAAASAQITGFSTANYRSGALAPAAGSSYIILADILVPASTPTQILNSAIVDRRPWSRGALNSIAYTAASKTVTSASMALIDSTNLNPRIECSGVPIRLSLRGRLSHTTTTDNIYFTPFVDGAAVGSLGDTLSVRGSAGAGGDMPPAIDYVITPAAGSHTIGWAWRTTGGTGTLSGAAGTPILFTLDEVVKPNTNNT